MMNNHKYERYLYAGVTAVLVIIAAVAVVFMFLERKSLGAMGGKIAAVLAPVIYGAVLAFLLSPVYNMGRRAALAFVKPAIKNEKTLGMIGKTVGTLVSLASLFVVVMSLSSMIIPQLYSSIVGIINTMPVYFQNIYKHKMEQ